MHRQAEAQGVTLIAVERLEEALVRLGITIEKVYLDTPYLGLQSFSYAERSIFFGREAAIEDLQAFLLQREQAGKPGVLIVAASGAGKSSLAQAGLLPALEKAGWPQTDSDNPPKQLRLALAARPVYWTETWKPQLASERSAAGLLRSIIDNWAMQPLLQGLPPVENLAQLADALAATAPKERRFLWLIDQLEELFTLSFPSDAIDAFADFLQRLQQKGVWLVAMLRNDFYSRYQEHEATEPGQARLIDVFGGAHYDLLKPDEAALRRIIEWPAEKAGLSFETATDGSTLAEQIAQDLREGGVDALPLLQFALRQLWDGRESGQNILTFKAYQAMGHLHGAIGQKAETIYQSLQPVVQAALPKLLWDLAIVREKHGDAGQRQYDYVAQTTQLSDYPEGGKGRELIEALADETVRLLVRDGGTVRVAHEALFRHWDTAQQQLAQLHEDMAVRERVRHEYEIWCAKGKTADLLLMPVMRLAEGEALLQQREAFLDADLLAYIRTSMQAEAERQRLEQERIQREQATAEEARQQAELAKEKAEQIALQQTELAQERQVKSEILRSKNRQFKIAAIVSLSLASIAGGYWFKVELQNKQLEINLKSQDRLVDAFNNVVIQKVKIENIADTLTSYEGALKSLKELSEEYPNQPKYLIRLALLFHNLATKLLEDGRNVNIGNQYFQNAFEIFENLIKTFPDEIGYQTYLEKSYREYADLLLKNSNLDDALAALKYRQKALTIRKRINFKNENTTQLAKIYGELSWAALLAKDFQKSLAYAEQGLKNDSNHTEEWIKINLAHALLFTGQTEKAEDIYFNNLSDDSDKKKLRKIFLNDFNEMAKYGLNHPDMDKIKSRLMSRWN